MAYTKTKMTTKRKYKRLGRRKQKTYYSIPSSVNSFNAIRFKQICQNSYSIVTSIGTNAYQFGGGLTYSNFVDILTTDTGFTANRVAYEKYRITGCVISVNRVFGDSQPDGLYLAGSSNLSNLYAMVYPNDTSVTATNNVYYNDSRLKVLPFLGSAQSKYFRFAPNSTSGTLGVGTWNDTSNYASQTGQVSIYTTNLSNAVANKNLYVMEIKLYIEYASYFK